MTYVVRCARHELQKIVQLTTANLHSVEMGLGGGGGSGGGSGSDSHCSPFVNAC